MVYRLELIFPHGDEGAIERFQAGLVAHLANPCNNFSLHSCDRIRKRCLDDLLEEHPLEDEHEICLDFITPFPFTPKERSPA